MPRPPRGTGGARRRGYRPRERRWACSACPPRPTGRTGRSETVELLVDTGAAVVVLRRARAERPELRPTRRCPIRTAGGRGEAGPLADIRLALDGDEVTPRCLGAPGGPPRLQAGALESLRLAVDPAARRLGPVTGVVG